MGLNTLKTGGGAQLRSTELVETQLPISYDASAMPGAIVLGENGRILTSVRNDQGVYTWQQVWTSNREQLLRIERDDPTASTVLLQKQRPGDQFVQSDGIGSIRMQARTFVGNTNVDCAEIRSTINSPTSVDTVSAAMDIFIRPLAEISTLQMLPLAVRINPNGNVLINNTTGSERLSVNGNIQIINPANGLRIGSSQVVGVRRTGWGTPTGTATRTAFDTQTVSINHLAERVKALIDDLTLHGLIGT